MVWPMRLFLLFILFFSINAQAKYCNDSILAIGPDSNHITIYAGNVLSNESEMMDEMMAINSANYMNRKFNCDYQLSNKNTQVKCSDELMKNYKICNIETEYGFYIVYKDYVDTVHITFSRWD